MFRSHLAERIECSTRTLAALDTPCFCSSERRALEKKKKLDIRFMKAGTSSLQGLIDGSKPRPEILPGGHTVPHRPIRLSPSWQWQQRHGENAQSNLLMDITTGNSHPKCGHVQGRNHFAAHSPAPRSGGNTPMKNAHHSKRRPSGAGAFPQMLLGLQPTIESYVGQSQARLPRTAGVLYPGSGSPQNLHGSTQSRWSSSAF